MGPTQTTAPHRASRILVIEDGELNARLACALLTKLGAHCDIAPDCASAIERLNASPYDAVFMDCGLPDGDGFELTRRIRRGACGSDRERIPIYAFTVDDDDQTRLRCAASGMIGFVRKPLHLAELRALLGSLGHPLPVEGHPAPMSHPVDSDRAIFDVQSLIDRVAGDCELATELVEAFIAQLPAQIGLIQRAIDGCSDSAPAETLKADCDYIASLAHQLKGAVGGISGNRLRGLAADIESAGHAQNVPLLRSLGRSLQAGADELAAAVDRASLSRTCADQSGEWIGPVQSAVPSTVLLAEDDATLRRMLTSLIERRGHRVLAADSVPAAIEMMARAEDSVECVVSDYRMPGESGLDLIAHVRREDPSIASIMMTADDEKQIVAASLRAGAFDFLQKPVNAAQLDAAVDAAVLRTREQRKLVQVRSDVAAMGRTQVQLLNSQGQSPLPVDFCYYPRLDAGGDFFSQFPLGEGRAIFLLTDVSGHDLQAAYLSAYFHGMTRGMLIRSASAREVFELFNRFLVSEWNAPTNNGDAAERQFASVAVASLLIDLAQGRIESLTCGAPAPSRVMADGRIHVVGERGGSPLGWFDSVTAHDFTSETEGGGEVLMWSDGLDELAQSVGASVLAASYLVRESRRLGVEHPLIAHAGDDLLLVSIGLDGATAQEDRFRPLIMWRYRGNQHGEIDDLVSYWRRSLRLALPELGDAIEHDIILATREAVLNGMIHGCRGRESETTKLQVSYRSSSRTLRVWVEDSGAGHAFDYAAHEKCAAESFVTEHRGLIFIHHLASSVRYERNGASLMLDFVIPEATSEAQTSSSLSA
jgi:CheY-like chemotaxis protein/anti-sigma regulatory factor (Ser/Thr protein kinase)